jgi:uncharacterized protein (TIGR02118 family)
MTKITILYPNHIDRHFDLDYYLKVHMPLSIEKLSAAEGFRSVTVEHGVSGPYPDTAPAFIAACHYGFDSYSAFAAAFTPHAEMLQKDILNYTDIEPIIQVSEIQIHHSASSADETERNMTQTHAFISTEEPR